MKKKSQIRKTEQDELCAEIREDDGLPPAAWAKLYKNTHRHVNYHGQQLCKQVRIAIDASFACDCADPLFEDLQVAEVRMAAGVAVLEVILTAPDQDALLLKEIETRLRSAEGLLRASIGGAIYRKRLPRLRFQLAPRS